MSEYPFLRKINLSNNLLTEVKSLQSIKYLTHLNLQYNHMTDLNAFNVHDTFPFLEELNLDYNKIAVVSYHDYRM